MTSSPLPTSPAGIPPVEGDLPGDEPVPGRVDVDPIVGQSEVRITPSLAGEESLHRAMDSTTPQPLALWASNHSE
jgi:hypothetical protein